MPTFRLLLPLALIAGLLALFSIACGDDEKEEGEATTPPAAEGDEAEIEAAIQAFVDAFNEADADAYLALVTDNYIAEQTDGLTRAEAAEELGEFLGDPQIESAEVSGIEVSGDTATAQLDAQAGRQLFRAGYDLVREGGEWKLDSEEELLVDIPQGVKGLNVELDEFAFGYNASEIEDGNIAFAVSNVGAQAHEFVLVSVNEEFTVDGLLQFFQRQEGGGEEGASPEVEETASPAEGEEEAPPGVEEFMLFEDYEPGESNNVVLAEELASGDYAFVCCFPDADDPEETPHCAKGMVSEFAIP